MITKVKNVYYCEFCKKHSLSGGSLSKHEKHCTGNPNRECRLCGRQSILDLIKKYKNAYKIIIKPESLDEPWRGEIQTVKWLKKISLENIKDDVENCPICTLAILRICKLNIWLIDEFRFDYKEELREWWNIVNDENRAQQEWDAWNL
jgi:hypothetical protein